MKSAYLSQPPEADVVREVVRLQLPCDGIKPLWGVNRLKRRAWGHDMHFELEVGIVLEGTLRRSFSLSSDGEDACVLEFGAGEVWMCGMWEAHGWEVVSPRERDLTLAIAPDDLKDLSLPEAGAFDWLRPFTLPPLLRPRLDELGRRRALEIAGRMLDLFPHADEIARLRARLLSLELLLLLRQGWQAPARRVETPTTRLAPAFRLVFESRQPVPVKDAARACGLNPDAFTKAFRELAGIAFPEFALRHRLGHSARELESTDLPLKAIAARWGFADASHLHRCFSRHYNLTPMQYRQSVRGAGLEKD